MQDYRMEHLFSYHAQLTPPEVIGPVPEGIRVNFYVTGGSIEGARLRGKVLPVGGDWLTIRADGVGAMDVRATLQSHDGALIYTNYTGIAELGADGYQRFVNGTPPTRFTLRTAIQARTAHPDYQWLNRLLCVGIGAADLEQLTVSYDVYGIS